MAPTRYPGSIPSNNSNDAAAQTHSDPDMTSSGGWIPWADSEAWTESACRVALCAANLMVGFGLGYMFALTQKREIDDKNEQAEQLDERTIEEKNDAVREIGEEVMEQEQKEGEKGEAPEIKLTALYIYPIKACAGVYVEKARVTDRGLENDRLFMIVDFRGQCVTQREHPRLALVQPKVEDDILVLDAPGMKTMRHTVKKWGTKKEVAVLNDLSQGIDQGDTVAGFFEEFLGVKDLRLVRMREGYKRKVNERYVNGTFETSFSDGFPYMLANEASKKKVSEEVGKELKIERFRPNLLVAGSIPAFEENGWRRLEIGDEVEFEVAKDCERCRVVTVDPATGEFDEEQEPLQSLARLRGIGDGKIVFGQNLVPTRNARGKAEIKVGDLVTVTERVVGVPEAVGKKG